MNSNELKTESKQFFQQGGYFELPPRTWLELTGKDRAAFLHNFCTADVKKMNVGEATELFILDSRGKTLAFGHVFCCENRLLISTADGQHSESVRQHLDKYVIREDVEVKDISSERQDLFVLGQASVDATRKFAELGSNECREVEFDEKVVLLAAIELAGFGMLLSSRPDACDGVRKFLADQDVLPCSGKLFDSLRLAAGTPKFGAEVDETNLPQELRRDEKAISFTKGCYLGQETVAKIDAIGHVNRFLVGVLFEGPIVEGVASDCEVTKDGAKIGALKSLADSPFHNQTIGMAYVKRKHASAGTEVVVGGCRATIVDFPI